MASEQNQDPEEIREQSEARGQMELGEFAPAEFAPPLAARRRWLSGRYIALLVLIPLVLLILVFAAGLIAVRTGYVGRYIEQKFVQQMDLVGVKTEIGEFHQTFAPLGVMMRDVKLYDKETNELLVKIGSVKLDATVTDLLALNLRRNVRLDSTEIENLEAWVKFDEQGHSNFSRLKIPEQEESNLTFSYSSMKFSLKNSLVHYGDLDRKLSGEARNVRLFIEPEAGLSKSEAEVENRRFKFDLAATNSNFTVGDKPIEPIDLSVKGVATESDAEIAELNLKTPFTESKLSGRLENWEKLKYKLNVVSTVDLQKTAETFKTEQALRGLGNFNGTIEGEGDQWTATGALHSDALAADNVRLKGLQINASVAGQSDAYEANGKAVAEMLNAGDFELDTLQLAGKVMGTGTDFRYLGDLQAAAAKMPGGKIANLILSDAVAEYRDSKLTADVASISANSLDAFDAKVRNLRASKAKITNANGVTNASTANFRAGTVAAQGAQLKGVSAVNVRVQNSGSATNVEVGNLQAENLAAKGANLRGLNAANVRANVRGNEVTAQTGNVAIANLQAQGVSVNGIRASGVKVDRNGSATNVVAENLQINGAQSAQATLGSINIAGVRLKIVDGGRIEGSTSDVNAGNIALAKSGSLLEGGKVENVRLAHPVFVIEPSGRYRASADLSLGGGALGSINVGAAKAEVTATSGQVELKNLSATLLEGNVDGNATIVYEGAAQSSRIAANFNNVDVAKILALAGGQVVAIAGKTSGTVNLAFPGLNYRQASGTLAANVLAEAGNDQNGRVPVTGKLGLQATNGLFDVQTANFKTGASELSAVGKFDLAGSDSNLNFALNSSNARELQQLISVLSVAPDLDKQLAQNKIELAGQLVFNGVLTGNLTAPNIAGHFNLESITANNRALGTVATDLAVNGKTVALKNGSLVQADGGSVKFDLNIPNGDTNNVAVKAVLNQVDVGNLLAALPIQDSLPAALKNIIAKASGQINLTGVPNNLDGTAEINSENGLIGGERFDSLQTKVTFQNSNILIDRFEARAGSGILNVKGGYEGENAKFNLDANGENLPLERLRGFFGQNSPNIAGTINFAAHGGGAITFTKAGEIDFSGFDINFSGAGTDIALDNRSLGTVIFAGKTENQRLTANVTATLNGQQQTVLADVNLADPQLPFRAETAFDSTDLAPFAALLPQSEMVEFGGRATGNAIFGGTLRAPNASGELVFSAANLKGEANFSQLTVQIQDAVLSIAEPLKITASASAVTINNARLVGTGSDLRINGTAVFAGNEPSDLTADGTINLRVLNFISNNQFFGGLADVSVRLFGASGNTRLSGSASLNNATFTTIISNERTTFTNIKGRILFASNQAQIERLEARLGGGTIVASGGILLENLQVQSYRLDVRGNDVTARLPQDFRTTGDAQIQISGRRTNGQFLSIISGDIYANRAEYTRDLDLADIVSTRRTGSISAGTGDPALGTPQLDLRITGRDALVVRNNIADLTGSLDLRVTGDVNEPVITGRVTATGGTIVLLNDKRYDITRATIDFPAQIDASPIVNFQGESDIGGYQVFLEAVGAIYDPNNLTLNLRSNPALPQADVVSLVTTGSLTNAAGGIPTFAQTGLNTAADLVTDALVNQPIRKATDRLFGLNRFEINPVLAGQRGINPSARLTVGRQINRNLSVTYSTNLSEDRNQIIALEYRVSNRISFVAQYEQASQTNVTRRPDNFSFEVRFRKRF